MGQGKNWKQEELDRLAEEWGQFSLATIAKRLGRSENAILVMVGRLHLGAHIQNSELISLNTLFKELGWDGNYSSAYKRLKAAGLKIHTHKVRRCSFRMVDIDEFWEFAEKNKRLFDFSKLERNALGIEPEWLKAKRAEDYERARNIKPNQTKWTEAEDNALRSMLRAYRYTFPEISAKLGRTEGAIQKRMIDLGIKERPLKIDNHTKWTREELQTVCRMIKDGSTYESISYAVGKSVKSIRGRVFAMYLTENLDKACKLIGDGEWGDGRPERTLAHYKLMTIPEKKQTKQTVSTLAGLLKYQIGRYKHFEDRDNWQRNLCRYWDNVKGCTAGGSDCDNCADFLRILPQYCEKCGATFYERKENRLCERCRKEATICQE